MSPIRPRTRPHDLFKTASGSRLELPAVAGNWSAEILKEAYRTIPDLQDLGVELRLERVNEVRGFAKGQLVAKQASAEPGDKGTTEVVFPVTISNRKMDPLDVMLYRGVSYPLSPEKMREIFANPGLGALDQDWQRRPVERAGGAGFAGQPPGDQGSNRWVEKQAGLLHLAAVTATPEDRAAFAQVAGELDRTSAEFTAAAAFILEQEPPSEEMLKQAAEALRPVDLAEFRCQRGGGYTYIEVSRSPYHEHVQTLTRVEVEAMLGPEKLAELDTRRVLRFTSAAPASDVAAPVAVGLAKTATARVFTDAGVPEIGLVLREPIDIFTQQASSGFLAVFPRGCEYTGAEKVAGVHLADFTGLPPEAADLPPAGAHGVLMWKQAGEWVGTFPMLVRSRVTVEGRPSMLVESEGRRGIILPADVLVPVRTSDGVLYPKTAGFVRCPPVRVKLTDPELVPPQKVAADLRVQSLGQGSVRLSGPAVVGVDHLELNGAEAYRALALLGVRDPEGLLRKTAGVRDVDVATSERLLTVEGLGAQWVKDDAVAQQRFQACGLQGFQPEAVVLAAALGSFAEDHADQLQKVAGLPPVRDTIDQVLSLNFLNPDNVRILQGYLPSIEKCASRLAELLVATRLGLIGDPEPIRLAMQYVQRTATQLRQAAHGG